ncbi:zinc finger CCCH domain-containing protein 62-like isoform X2 [Nicotiana tomentosiformis]|uniref:zinc finger CCCH domain-containing protein 62-like isoform X2 n=1 Tax=Nicotiana tomentosiformis TaxID=4098 RepID=UPI00051C3DB3|nr:zinc finger CCCH domain-containing protein 62-like isoform X1 [Nicotiana tomentosiformis]
MATRRGAKRSVIEISSSSEQENGDEEYEGSSEESEPLSESDDDDFDSSASSESDGDYEEYDDEDDIEEESKESECDRVLRLLQGVGDLKKLKGELRKLTLTDYKAYLRSNGLRLSGTKEECVERIIEHWRMKDGNGQRLYPRSSFTINCTGDVCKGDVVLFTQKVYKNFDKMTRGGELLGKRTIAGRIVKESYGATKQQHTFTVEVLWSQGVKKLSALFPLLVKGRNLYKLKTFRQRWKNEKERLEVLAEKHKRGEAARFIRATRKSKSIKPTKVSSKNKGNKRQKLDHHRRPSEMIQTSKVKKHNCSIDERGKAMVRSKRKKHRHEKPRPPGRLNLAESRNSRAPMRHPNIVPAIGETSLQFNYPSTNNFRHFESDYYGQGGVPYSYSSNWHSAPRSHLSSYSSYALPAPDHQQYDHGSYPIFSYPRYVSQSSNHSRFLGMVGTHRSSGSFPFVNYERR